jgi:hypothetical protein
VDESVPESQPVPPVTPEAVIGSPPPRNLPAALEPELRRIIDTAVARVAEIELEAIREARHLNERSEREARAALRFALDHGLNLVSSLDLLAAAVSGMAEAVKTELDDAMVALRRVSEPAPPEAETPAEPRVRLTPLVRPAARAPAEEPAEAAADAPPPEKVLVTSGAPAERSRDRRTRLRRFFTR